MSIVAVLNEFSVEAIKDALQKLDSFENLKVNGLNAHQLTELDAIAPDIFSSVADQIKNGRWFPYAGAWTSSEELSETALIKSCLYSVRYFLDTFGQKYRVFHGRKIYNNMLPQIVYSSLFDAVVLDEEKESKWLHGADDFRTLVITSDTVDVNDIDDEFISSNEFISYEELADNLFDSHLELETVFLPSGSIEAKGFEKNLIDAEKSSAINGENKTADIRDAWIAYFDGSKQSDLIADIASAKNDFELHGDGVVLAEAKLAEDGSGDTVIRVAETNGKEQSAYIMCNRLNSGFRFEIMPYEMPTFRISNDGNGYAKEIYICE
ncbi:MAG TPA: hypothetical protein DCY15_04960 [Ruminococcaceae bacterium]|nr:hypothetical protein [Oscillospiraceae bacterium]